MTPPLQLKWNRSAALPRSPRLQAELQRLAAREHLSPRPPGPDARDVQLKTLTQRSSVGVGRGPDPGDGREARVLVIEVDAGHFHDIARSLRTVRADPPARPSLLEVQLERLRPHLAGLPFLVLGAQQLILH